MLFHATVKGEQNEYITLYQSKFYKQKIAFKDAIILVSGTNIPEYKTTASKSAKKILNRKPINPNDYIEA